MVIDMKAVINVDVPEWQIGQDVSIYFPDSMLKHGKCLLKEEEEIMSWTNVKDELPNENGLYLVIYKAFEHTFIDVKQFAKDLYSIDKYDFLNKHRPGWYEYDNEYGYIERNNITHWMPLPNPPEEGR